MYAASQGQMDVAKALIGCEANVNASSTKVRQMPCHTKRCTAQQAVLACSGVLVLASELSALCLLQGSTALMQAAAHGHLDMVNYLLSSGADKAALDDQVMQQRLLTLKTLEQKHTNFTWCCMSRTVHDMCSAHCLQATQYSSTHAAEP